MDLKQKIREAVYEANRVAETTNDNVQEEIVLSHEAPPQLDHTPQPGIYVGLSPHNIDQGTPSLYRTPPIPILQPNSMEQFIQATNQQENLQRAVATADKQFHLARIKEDISYRNLWELPPPLHSPTEFPLGSLPGTLQDLIVTASKTLHVSTAASAMGALGALFVAARGNFVIRMDNVYTEALTNYLLTVAPSGSRKSAICSFYKAPILAYEQELQRQYDAHMPKAHVARNIFNQMEKYKIKKNIQLLGVETLNAEQMREAADMLATDVCGSETAYAASSSRPKLLTDTPTMIKLAEIMAEQGETIGIMEPEGALLKAKLQSTRDDILLKAFSMEAFADESRGAKAVVMSHPCLAISIMTQDSVAEKLFSKDHFKNDGLLPRFLTCFAMDRVDISSDCSGASDEVAAAYGQKINALLRIDPLTVDGIRKSYEISLSPMAEALRFEYTRNVQARRHYGEFASHEAFGEKLVGHAIRLAGALHLWLHDTPHEHAIAESTMRGGIALADFFAANAKIAFDIKATRGLRIAHRLLTWITEHRHYQFSSRDAQRRIGNGGTADDIRVALRILEQHGYIGRYITPKQTTCVVNPRIFGRF